MSKFEALDGILRTAKHKCEENMQCQTAKYFQGGGGLYNLQGIYFCPMLKFMDFLLLTNAVNACLARIYIHVSYR